MRRVSFSIKSGDIDDADCTVIELHVNMWMMLFVSLIAIPNRILTAMLTYNSIGRR